MNRWIGIGRLTKDPELRFTANGKAVTTFGIAVNNPYKKDDATFINVVVWGKSAESCANYLAKGRLVGLEGRLQSRSYETQNGEKRYVTEVIADQVEFLEWGNKEGQSSPSKRNDDFGSIDIDMNDFHAMDDDEDIPF